MAALAMMPDAAVIAFTARSAVFVWTGAADACALAAAEPSRSLAISLTKYVVPYVSGVVVPGRLRMKAKRLEVSPTFVAPDGVNPVVVLTCTSYVTGSLLATAAHVAYKYPMPAVRLGVG